MIYQNVNFLQFYFWKNERQNINPVLFSHWLQTTFSLSNKFSRNLGSMQKTSINGLSTWRKHMGTGSSGKAFGSFAEVRCWRPRVAGHPRTVWPSQEEPGSGLTASVPVSCISAPACTNRVWHPLRPVSVAQKNKPSTMFQCPTHRPPHELHSLTVLDDETTEWLLTTCPEI